MLRLRRTLSASHSHLLTFATLGASAAPFVFTAATAGTGNFRICLRNFRILYYVILGLDPRISVLGNSRILSDEILRSSRGMTQGRNSSFRNSRFCLRNSRIAVAE